MLGIQGRTSAAPQGSPVFTQATVGTAQEVSKGALGSLPTSTQKDEEVRASQKFASRLSITRAKPGSNKRKLLFSSYQAPLPISSCISEWQEKKNLTPLILYHYFKAQRNSGPMVSKASTAHLGSPLSLCHPLSPYQPQQKPSRLLLLLHRTGLSPWSAKEI